MSEGKLKSVWEAAAYDREKQEWVYAELHSFDHAGGELTPDMFVSQAAPTKIVPSRAKPITRDHELIGVIPDIQYGFRHIEGEVYQPLHDQRAMNVAKHILSDVKPETIVLMGDLLDFSNLSKYEDDSQHFANTLQMSLDGLHRYLAELRSNHPDSKMVWIAGNHEQRLVKTVLRYTAQIVNIRQANRPDSWNVLSVPFLMRTDELGIEYYGGYPANEYQHDEDTLFVHGTSVRSNGSTAEQYSKKYPDTNVFFGHVHRHELHTRTRRNGQYLISATFGTLASTDGRVPSYGNGIDDANLVVKHQENWQQGIGLIRNYGAGDLEVNQIFIRDGKARYNGREYSG